MSRIVESRKGLPGRYNVDYGMGDAYKWYCREYKNPGKLTQKQYTSIWKEYIGRVIDLIIFENMEYRLPSGLGYLSIVKRKTKVYLNRSGRINKKQLSPDWGTTRKLWKKDPEAMKSKKVIYHMNKHTDGYKYRFFWSKRHSNITNMEMYSLSLSRIIDRYFAKCLFEYPYLNYFERPVRK